MIDCFSQDNRKMFTTDRQYPFDFLIKNKNNLACQMMYG